MKSIPLLLFSLMAFCFPIPSHAQITAGVLENDYFRYEIGANGRNLKFIDKQTGKDYCDRSTDTAFAWVKNNGQVVNASSVSFENNRIQILFGKIGFKATVEVSTFNHYLKLKVTDVQGGTVESLTFIDLSLLQDDSQNPSFKGCSLALNLQTNVPEMPDVGRRIRAVCYSKFGMVGAEMALLGCPVSQMRAVMKEVISQAKNLPHSILGGPWAVDAEINKGSYLFNYSGITDQTIDRWIALVKQMGFNQIDFNYPFRYGDFKLNTDLYPRGRESLKAIIDKLHAAGISAGMHTYSFFIDKSSSLVTPIPDPRLGKDATFTLTSALSADAVNVPVVESTQSMSTTTGFFVRNSVTLQIDNELITYNGINKTSPYAFTQCQRGAYGTQAAAHSAGAKVYHLMECFGYFAPDGDSTLLTEIAAQTAEIFNECGFDMIYLDALDGEVVLGGYEYGWYYGSKFVFELFSRLRKPALMEMSTNHHHLWYVRSRLGARDHPNRGHKRFIDIHCQYNNSFQGTFLPGHLGWWSFLPWNGIQGEPTFADDIEYLCCKCIGTDVGFSIQGINIYNNSLPVVQRLAGIMQRYEKLRQVNYFDESVKTQLRIPGKEFTLESDSKGRYGFRPMNYLKHKVEGLRNNTNAWEAVNPYPSQPLRLRLEALMSVKPYEAGDGVTLVDFSNANVLNDRASQDGVSFGLNSTSDNVKGGNYNGVFTAVNNGLNPADSSWAKAGKIFSPALNLNQKEGLGVWINGDGKNEVINVQLQSPVSVSRSQGEHYIRVNFTGWRYFELVETESDRFGDYKWPYGDSYSIYRESVNFSQIETLALWYNNLPLDQPVRCQISPIKALPTVSIKIKNPNITLNGKTVIFPVTLESGQYLEFNSLQDCKWYGVNGELIQEIKPQGEIPNYNNGANQVLFSCDDIADVNVRARVTLISQGSEMLMNALTETSLKPPVDIKVIPQ